MPFSSGDVLADRRASFAQALADDGQAAEAADVMQGALELVPTWAAGWYLLGEFLEAAGKLAGAIEAWDHAVAADPADSLGAGLKRDLLRRVPMVDKLPPAFVELLFDQYAPKFEAALVGKLDYQGPDLLMSALEAAGFTRAARAFDLGCGTGLMGEQLRSRVDWLAGSDISAQMLLQAEAKGIYDQLEKADIDDSAITDARYDLIVAADVFVYLGALERVVGWCAASLTPGGHLAFSVEQAPSGVVLQESRRFAHGADYITALLTQAGFANIRMTPCVIRRDRGEDIQSLTVTALAPALTPRREGSGEAETFA